MNVVAGEQVTRESLTVVLPRTPESRASLPRPPRINSNAVPPPPAQGLSGSVPVRELRDFKPVEKRDTAPATPLRIEEPPPVVGAAPAQSGTLPVLSQAPVSLPAPVGPPAAA
ncbi:MAG: hypothetical protein NTW28_06395, partial [Candidatus Solibacter sp.]|nr:hypothetical protein [Candidatus Solibacter sp.]